jgi:cation transport ATPase
VGSGVRCETDSGVVLVGNRTLMDEQQVSVDSNMNTSTVEYYCGVKFVCVGYFCVCFEMLERGLQV